MEDRTIKLKGGKTSSDALDIYQAGISDLRSETLDIASSVLSQPPSYWNSNPEMTSGLLRKLNKIKLNEIALDTYKDIHCSAID